MLDDNYFMRLALLEAQKAMQAKEIPIGCVIVANEIVIAKAHNLTETMCDVTAHAEMQAINAAADSLGAKYLNDCTLYVTLEPCVMCVGATFWAKLGKIVFGAKDVKQKNNEEKLKFLHPHTQWIGGVLEKECQQILQQFFEKKR
ncbi:MAG: nucleoside deaminase [Bacteroidales bacterium]|jgi:tRNA(adenine34) deaminase|nr:nucleoside deaminase [Bacteroidales bacterium]